MADGEGQMGVGSSAKNLIRKTGNREDKRKPSCIPVFLMNSNPQMAQIFAEGYWPKISAIGALDGSTSALNSLGGGLRLEGRLRSRRNRVAIDEPGFLWRNIM
jgi:hypothetical protein